MYLASTWHGSGGNVTAEIERMGLNIDYNSSFLRQEESQYLANPPEIARHFPTHIQKLCGYVCPTLQSERDEEPRIGLRLFISLFISLSFRVQQKCSGEQVHEERRLAGLLR